MNATPCTRHSRRHCLDRQCRLERENRAADRPSTTDPLTDPLSVANPISPTHQAVYGGPFYGTPDPGPSTSSYDCGSSSSSSSYSGDSGSSSSSCD